MLVKHQLRHIYLHLKYCSEAICAQWYNDSMDSMMPMTISPSYFDQSGSSFGDSWFRITARWEGAEDDFEFCIPIFEGFKHPDKTISDYHNLALECVNNYRRRFGFVGGQSHIFDFMDSDFIPREDIDWP